MITVTLQFDDLDHAAQALATLRELMPYRADKAAAAAIKRASMPDPIPATVDGNMTFTPVSAGATKAPAEQAAPPSAPDAAADASAPAALTYDAVHAAITQAVAGGRRPQVVAALAKFGAKKGPDLKPEQWADFVREVQA